MTSLSVWFGVSSGKAALSEGGLYCCTVWRAHYPLGFRGCNTRVEAKQRR